MKFCRRSWSASDAPAPTLKQHKLRLRKEPQNSRLLRHDKLRLNRNRQQSKKPLLKDKLRQNKKGLRQPLSWPKSRLAQSA